MGWRASGILGGFNPPLQSMPASSPHSSASAVLHCMYFQELKQGHFPQKSAASPPYAPPPPLLQPYLVLSHSMLFPAILGWLHPCQCMRHTHQLFIFWSSTQGRHFSQRNIFFFCIKIVQFLFSMNNHSLTCFQTYLWRSNSGLCVKTKRSDLIKNKNSQTVLGLSCSKIHQWHCACFSYFNIVPFPRT